MATAHIFTIAYALFSLYMFREAKKKIKIGQKNAEIMFWVISAVALLLRMIAGGKSLGFPNDSACFYAWSYDVFENGFYSFYTSGTFADYPPGAVYILYWVGALLHIFHSGYQSFMGNLIIKLPSILCDIGTAFFIWKIGHKKKVEEYPLLILIIMYLTNPSVFLNSSLWGQVDSIFTLAVLLMCWFLTQGATIPAYIIFGLGVLIKPQTCVFAPVLIYGIIDQVILHNFTWKNFFKNLFSGLAVIAGMMLLCTPFGLDNAINQYMTTLSSYPYIAVNAFNFWGFFGLNWCGQDTPFLFTNFKTLGNVVIVLIVILSALLFFKNKDKESRYFSVAAFIITTMFLFSIRMHERYVYPVMALLLLTYLLSPLKEYFITFIAMSLMHFYNIYYVLYHYDVNNYDRKAPLFLAVSAGTVLTGIFLYYTLIRYQILSKKTVEAGADTEENAIEATESESFSLNKFLASGNENNSPIRTSEKAVAFTKLDALLLLLIVGLYSFFAFRDLGGHIAPTSQYEAYMGDEINLTFSENQMPVKMAYFLGHLENREFLLNQTVLYAAPNGEMNPETTYDTLTMISVFAWAEKDLSANMVNLKMSVQNDVSYIKELCFFDAEGNMVTPLNADAYPELFDEPDTYPTEGISFRNSTYFDEIYHARTAYEFLNGYSTYETTHPPFGKVLISLGILLFGMNPFGWRVVGTTIGILMLPVLYLLAKEISKNTWCAAFATFLFAFDFMHFAQTRIATIDVYVTFFIILMYYFMYGYQKLSFYDTPLKKTYIPLGLCGIAMGFGVASKWTGVYAGVGLAVIFFLTMLRRYMEYRYACTLPERSTGGISHRLIKERFPKYFARTIGFCMGFFVAIPAIIYTLSYIPFQNGETNLIKKMIANQSQMLDYHAKLEATHYYSSSWDQWPLITKPIFYYYGVISDEGGIPLRQGISAFGNPLVWWIGIPAFLFLLYLVIQKKDRNALFVCIGYLAQYLPWMLVPRLTFIYHYFPSVPFVVLMILYSLVYLQKYMPKKVFYIILAVYAVAVFALFLVYYPLLSGQTVDASFVIEHLRLGKEWILILE